MLNPKDRHIECTAMDRRPKKIEGNHAYRARVAVLGRFISEITRVHLTGAMEVIVRGFDVVTCFCRNAFFE
jgi:hypothetical protein